MQSLSGCHLMHQLVPMMFLNPLVYLDANTPPPAANPRSEQNTNTGSFELWAL